MNVLMINDYGASGGAAFYVNNLSKELRRRGHHIGFMSSDQYDGKPGNNTHEFRAVKGSVYTKSVSRLHNKDAQRVLRRLIEETCPDIIHVHCFDDQVSPLALIRSIPFGSRVVVTLHDDSFVHPSRKRRWGTLNNKEWPKSTLLNNYRYLQHSIVLTFFKRVSAFISPSKFLAEELSLLGREATIIPNGVPIKPVYTKPKNPNLLYVGRVDPDKGVMYAVEALYELRKAYPKLHLTIVGDGSELDKLKYYVETYGLHYKVTFAGHVPPNKLKKYYQEAGIVLVPSICQDNQPTTILEASCYGRAVVASDVGGIPELVNTGVNGACVPAGDASAIIRIVSMMIKDKSHIFMGKNAFIAAKNYSMKENASKVLEVYKEVMK